MRDRTTPALFTGLVALVALAACDTTRPIAGEAPPGGTYDVPIGDPTGGSGGDTGSVTVATCTACHGTPGFDNTGADPLVAAAPPRGLLGDSVPAVGAHRAHLLNGPLSDAVECASCHLVPTAPAPHARQRQGKVSFSRRSTTAWIGAPVSPTWNGTTCASTYCHGNFRNGNLANAPSWNGGAADGACGSCHGVPPGGTHAQDAVGAPLDCGTCHEGYTRTTVNLALHVNGRLDATNLHPPGWKEPDQHGLDALAGGFDTCTICHTGFGSPDASASTSCDACHASPSLYGPYATGTYPDHASWQTECTFCHGGTNDATGAPPRNTQIISSDTTTPQPTTDATIGAHTSHVGATHGIAAPLACTACHETTWASATDPGHVDGAPGDVFFNDVGPTANPGSYARPDCSSTYCHGDFTGGAGSGPIQWTGTFGGPFTLGCTSCHGQPPGPTSATVHHPPNPSCGSCHDYAAATHVNGVVDHTPATGCTQCHGDLGAPAVASGDVLAAPGSNASAVSAHGDAATATSARGIGAHARHLTGTTWRATPIACGECHAVPATGDTAHANGNTSVAFGALASTAWSGQPTITPAWNGAGGAPTLTCSSTYCHGAFKNGANATPTWATPSAVGCGSCHGVSPTSGPGGTHPTFGAGQTCGSCHGGTYTNGSVDPALHLNGALDVANLTCSSCHGDAARTPVASANVLDALGGNLVLASPPSDAGGGPAATGAHLAHVNQGDTAAPGPLSNALACSSCHSVPTAVGHSNGAVGVTFAGLAVTGGATPSPYDAGTHTCASTYCHGNFTGGAGANAITWTATGKRGCASCHGAPPATSATVHHPPNPACASCHTGYTSTTVSVASHVNGTVEHAPASGCTQCHGDLTASGVASTDVRAAPASNANAVSAHGDAAAATSARGIGAHARHLTGTTWRATPITCGECHGAVSDSTHANGNPAVAFGALATTAWTGPAVTPVWNGAGGAPTLTCSSTYCHGNFPNGANASPTWAAPSAVACGACHGVSATSGPGGTHPTFTTAQTCGDCHGGTYTNTSVDLALHLNGQLDAGGAHAAGWKEPDQHGLDALAGGLGACTACHTGFGSPTANAGSSCNACHASPALYGPYTTGTYPDHASWQTECTFCHGGTNDATGAPPRNTHVVSSDGTTPQPTTDATIGAHASHVGATHGIAAPLACTACHETTWASATDPGHVDTAPAEVFFNPVGPAANPGGYARPDCSSTYCHGNFTGGAGSGAVAWTGTFGGPFTLGCGSCHGAPPGPTSATVHHPPNPSCNSCHTGYGATTVAVATHVNGAIEHTPATGCTQCHGDLTASGVASTDLRAAPASNANAVSAHGDAATATSARGIGAHARHLTGTTWRATPIACGECHGAVSDSTHANGNPAVAFGALARTAWAGEPTITPAWNGAGGAPTLTCSSTYCHGAFKNGANATPTWAAPSAVGCGSCHGVSPTSGPGGTHPTFGAGQTCGDCHGGTYTNGSVDPALHLNGALDVGSLTCSTCHGDAARTPVASATVLDALGANLVLASPPADAGGGAAATGAHLAHVNQGDTAAPGPLSNALACSSCHAVPTSVGHSNGTVAVAFSGLAVTGGATPSPYDAGTHTCASTYCHGNFTGGAGANAITWTATGKLACTSCHGAPPATSATVHHPPNPACGSCHTGYGATTVAAAAHVNGTIEHTPATGCTQCHGDLTASGVASTDVRAAPAANANAVSAHGDAATATSARGVGAHAAHLTGTTWRATPIACGECHAVPGTGDVSHANANPAMTFGALATTAWSGPAVTPVWNGAGGAPTLTCSSTYCHGNFPNGANASPTWAAPSAVGCGSCHLVSLANGPGGTHPTLSVGQDCGTCHGGTYTSASVDPALHLNGVLDGGGESGGGATCAGCHTAIFQAMNGGIPHVSRHGLGALAGTNDSPVDSGLTWGNPLSANAAASRSCVNMCHGDHPHDLQSPATATHGAHAYADAATAATRANATANRIGPGGTGGSVNRLATDFDPAQANGGLCASCHRNPVDAARPAVDAAAFAASAHDFTANPVGGYAWSYTLHDGGVFARNCTKCHASSAEGTTPQVSAGQATAAVHFGDEPSLLAGATNPAGTAAGFVCYNCHGSAGSPADGAQGDRSGKDIQSQIAKARAHPANADAVHDGAAELANAAFGNELGVPAGPEQRHASCLDCHASHEARPGTHATPGNLAGPPLEGAWGAQLTTSPAFWSAPTSASFTKKTIVAGTDLEATLCFKCHSSYYGTLPTSPSGGYTETDTAKEFNPNNAGNWFTTGTTTTWSNGESAGGFHPVLADAGNNLGRVNMANLVTTSFPWRTTGARNVMTCTDCHESNSAADPNGPHGSTAGFILRGPNTTWSQAVTLGSSIPAGTFCLNCHQSTFTNSRFTQHSRNDHYLSCWNCHARVPHGGPRPGMLVAGAGASTNVGGVIAGWDQTAPYWGGTASNRLYIVSYPSNGTNTWTRSNCGCNGTNH